MIDKIAMLKRYDPATGPTPQSVVFDLLEAINHAALLKAGDRRKAVKLIETSGLGHDPNAVMLARRLLNI